MRRRPKTISQAASALAEARARAAVEGERPADSLARRGGAPDRHRRHRDERHRRPAAALRLHRHRLRRRRQRHHRIAHAARHPCFHRPQPGAHHRQARPGHRLRRDPRHEPGSARGGAARHPRRQVRPGARLADEGPRRHRRLRRARQDHHHLDDRLRAQLRRQASRDGRRRRRAAARRQLAQRPRRAVRRRGVRIRPLVPQPQPEGRRRHQH